MNEPGPQPASQGRRLGGAVVDIALFILTLGIGWATAAAADLERREHRAAGAARYL